MSEPGPAASSVILANAGTQCVTYRSVRGWGAQVMRRIANGRDRLDSVPTQFRTPHASKGSVDLSGSLPQAARYGMAIEHARCQLQPLGSRLRGNDGSAAGCWRLAAGGDPVHRVSIIPGMGTLSLMDSPFLPDPTTRRVCFVCLPASAGGRRSQSSVEPSRAERPPRKIMTATHGGP